MAIETKESYAVLLEDNCAYVALAGSIHAPLSFSWKN